MCGRIHGPKTEIAQGRVSICVALSPLSPAQLRGQVQEPAGPGDCEGDGTHAGQVNRTAGTVAKDARGNVRLNKRYTMQTRNADKAYAACCGRNNSGQGLTAYGQLAFGSAVT